MKFPFERGVGCSLAQVLLPVCLGGLATSAFGQPGAPAPITQLTTVEVRQSGSPPSGP